MRILREAMLTDPVLSRSPDEAALALARSLGSIKAMHASTQHILQFFKYDHLPETLQEVSEKFSDLAVWMVNEIEVIDENGGPELTACLRKLLEAKDCAVRAKLAKSTVPRT